MPIPDEIKRHRPRGTEIHRIRSSYYVYETTSVWDPERKRPRKKTGRCVGKITEADGFVPSPARPAAAPAGGVVVKEYGCWALFSQLLPDMRPSLRAALGDGLGDRAYALAMVRLMGRATKAQASRYFRGSWLSEELPGLALSEASVTAAMRELGRSRPQMMAYMRARMPGEGATLLFDGTQVLCSSAGMTYARYGRSGRRQVNVMYVFDASDSRPVWHRLLPGNVADVAAFKATLDESGASGCAAVGDKGFFSKANAGALDAAGMSYVLPLRSNTTMVDTSFLSDEGTSAFDGCFRYHGRAVWHRSVPVGRSGKTVRVFRDTGKRAQLESNYVGRMEAGYAGKTREGLEGARPMWGVSLLYTNMAASDRDVYLTYKARWEIEELFDYLKNGLDLGTVYQRTNEEAEAWAFLNHLSMEMFYALYRAVARAGLGSRWTPEAVMAAARNVSRVRIGDEWVMSEVSKGDREVFAKLGVTL